MTKARNVLFLFFIEAETSHQNLPSWINSEVWLNISYIAFSGKCICGLTLLAQAFGTSLLLLSVKTSTRINPKPHKGQRNILPWLHPTPAYASFCVPVFCVTVYVPAQRHVFSTIYQYVVSNQQAHLPEGTYLPCTQSPCINKVLYKTMWYSSAFLFPMPTSEHINLSNLPTIY